MNKVVGSNPPVNSAAEQLKNRFCSNLESDVGGYDVALATKSSENHGAVPKATTDLLLKPQGACMLRLLDEGPRLCDGITRREMLRIGGIGLGGLSLGSLLAARQSAASPRGSLGKAKSVIVFGLVGGTPQHETWDPKPEAPEEIRGDFGVIDSATPGLRVGELMPRTAKMTDRIAVLRAVVSGDNAHSSSGYQMLTGIPHQPLNRESALPKPPNSLAGRCPSAAAA